jgi:DNA-binding CsgD family transcriptional regulator
MAKDAGSVTPDLTRGRHDENNHRSALMSVRKNNERPTKNFPDWLNHSIDAMFGIDGKQQVTFWNQACEDLTGVSAAKAVGSPCHEILQGHEPSGRAFCRPNCPLGQLAKGGPSPKDFAMRVSTREMGKIQLNVGTMLIPSPVDQEWMVVHFMRRGHCKSSAGLSARDNAVRNINGKNQQQGTAGHASRGLGLLTERERDILCLLTDGLTTDAISHRLHISMTTVRNHIQRLMAKLNVHTRIEAVNCAHRHRLVRTNPEPFSGSAPLAPGSHPLYSKLSVAR